VKDKKIVVAIAAVFIAGAAPAQSFPKLKAGLWETKTQSDHAKGQPMPTTLMCIDDTVIEPIMKLGQGIAQGFCSKNEMSVAGNKVFGSSECKLGNSTVRSKSTTTFNGDTSYRTESKSTYEPPLRGVKDSTLVAEAKYIGPCKTGMKPGDISVGGATVNIFDMTRASGAQKK
jgi:hypothetical protein